MQGLKSPKLGKGLGSALPTPSFPKVEGVLSPSQSSASAKNPMKVGDQATVKMPKSKSLPDATDKPSTFFKSEDFASIKKPSVEKLRAFLEKTRAKR